MIEFLLKFRKILKRRGIFLLIVFLLLFSMIGTYLFNIIRVRGRISSTFEVEKPYTLKITSKILVYKVYLTFITSGPDYTRSTEENNTFALYMHRNRKRRNPTLLGPIPLAWWHYKVKLTVSIPPSTTVVVSWKSNGVLREIIKQVNREPNPLIIEFTLGVEDGENKYYISVENLKSGSVIVKIKRPTFIEEELWRPYLHVSILCYIISLALLIVLLNKIRSPSYYTFQRTDRTYKDASIKIIREDVKKA